MMKKIVLKYQVKFERNRINEYPFFIFYTIFGLYQTISLNSFILLSFRKINIYFMISSIYQYLVPVIFDNLDYFYPVTVFLLTSLPTNSLYV